jgi:hypothetical protein
MAESEFWGAAAALASTPVAVAAGVAKGSHDAATGNGPFIEGFETASRTVTGSAEKFGKEHGGTITNAVIMGCVGLAFSTLRGLGSRR